MAKKLSVCPRCNQPVFFIRHKGNVTVLPRHFGSDGKPYLGPGVSLTHPKPDVRHDALEIFALFCDKPKVA